jgi:CHASE2 domain-containing sensor protein
MKKHGSLSMLVVGTVIVAVICSFLVEDGWLIWLPVLPALAVVGVLVRRIG